MTLTINVPGQTFVTLHSFTALDGNSNSDGATPIGGLILSDNTLYGTSTAGGSAGSGTVFSIKTDGNGFTNLHDFTGPGGAAPWTDLLHSGGSLYGTTQFGGTEGVGTIFSLNVDGTGFVSLYSFTNVSGVSASERPQGPLVLANNVLYGSGYTGGLFLYGFIFALSTNGTGFTNLFTFTGGGDTGNPSPLVLSAGNLYGTTFGGNSGIGTVFAFSTDSDNRTTIYSFTSGSNGIQPGAGLILSNNMLYGTTRAGGNFGSNDSGWGTVFSLNTTGTGFTVLHAFTPGSSAGSQDQYMWAHSTNIDGAVPTASLLLSGTTLYGTTYTGGAAGNGTVFAVNIDGTGFTNLHTFTAMSLNSSGYFTNSDGANLRAGLTLSGNALYGTTIQGGNFGNGTVFSIHLPSSQPQLSIQLVGANAVLTWPTNFPGFSLQSSTNTIVPSLWTTVPTGPAVLNGQNVVTNPISGAQQFFRLSQ